MIVERIGALDIAAASGLVVVGDELVVIADDRLELSRYAFDGTPRSHVRLFEGELPEDPVARKHAKPDLEALVALPDGSLLAFGSGSKKRNRNRAALVRGDAVTEIDCTRLYDALREQTDRLNIEGAAVFGMELVLLTRRTGSRGRNTLVRLDLRWVMDELPHGILRPRTLIEVVDVDLGEHEGVPFGFGDAAVWDRGLLFAAAAEDTDDPVYDGVCVASEIGWLDARGVVGWTHRVEPIVKLEGIGVASDGRVFAVSDADDPTSRAQLFALRF